MDATSAADVDLLVELADAWLNDVVPNQPVHFNFLVPTQGMFCEVGDPFASGAIARWRAMAPEDVRP